MRVSVLGFPGCQPLDVVAALEVFNAANRQLGENRYEVEVVAATSGTLAGNSSPGLVPQRTMADPVVAVDTFLVAGASDLQTRALESEEARWIHSTASGARRYGSISSGAFIMARLGLFKDRRVTTHWSDAALLARLYPELIVEAESIFVCDGKVCTSAGAVASIDLSLALVEQDLGREVALATARDLVAYLKRPGAQSQFSDQLSARRASLPAIGAVQAFIAKNPTQELGVETLAMLAGMSSRNFSRIFLRETGMTPRDFVEAARIDVARSLINDGTPLSSVASLSGFGSTTKLRRAFERRLLTTPRHYQENFSGQRILVDLETP